MRTTFALFILAFGFAYVLLQPSVAFATPVRLIRIQEVFPEDALLAAELSASVGEAAGRVPGWTVSPVTAGLWDLMSNGGCIDVTHPGVECLQRLATTTGSGAYGAILIHGFMEHMDEGPGSRLRVNLYLYDAIEVRITHRVVVETTRAQLEDSAIRARLASAMVDRLSSSSPSDEVIRIDLPDPGGGGEIADPGPSVPDHTPLELAGWSLVGLAGAAAVVAIASGGVLLGHGGDERFSAYRASWDAMRVGNACEAAASDPSEEGRYALGVCNDASVHEVLVPLFWTVAALAGAAGTLLAWHPWSASAGAPEASLAPALGPTYAGLDLRGTF